VTVHAVDRDGNACVVALNISEAQHYWYWNEMMPQAERRRAVKYHLFAAEDGLQIAEPIPRGSNGLAND
jgi:hypothetical protein